MWCDTGQVLPRAGSQQFGEVSWGDLPYWGACLGPRIRLCSPGGFSQLLSWDFAGVRAFCPSHPSNTQQHLGLGIPQILPPAWNAHPAPSLPSTASRSPLGITPSRGALCGSTHPASYPRWVTTSPRAHSSLSLSLCVDLGVSCMYLSSPHVTGSESLCATGLGLAQSDRQGTKSGRCWRH